MIKFWKQAVFGLLLLGGVLNSNAVAAPQLLYSNTYDARRIGPPSPAEFSHSGNLLAVIPSEGNTKGKILIWNVRTGKIVRSISAVLFFAFSPDDRSLAVISVKSNSRSSYYYHPPALYSVQLLDIRTGTLQKTFDTFSATTIGFCSVAISSDNKLLAAGKEGLVQVWNIKSGKRIAFFKHEDFPYALTFSPDGRYLATGGGDYNHVVHLWPLRGNAPYRLFQVGEFHPFLLFTRDSKDLIANGPNRGLNVYPVSEYNAQGQTPWSNNQYVQDSPEISLSAHGSLISYVYNGQGVIWDAQSKRIVKTYKIGSETRQIIALHFVGDHLYWATSDYDNDNIYRIRLYHAT